MWWRSYHCIARGINSFSLNLLLFLVYPISDFCMEILRAVQQQQHEYCTILTVSSRILKICWPRWPINFLSSSSDLKQGLFSWPLRVTERNGTVLSEDEYVK